VDEERLSRWAAGITGGFFLVLWPAIVVFALVWDCSGKCKTQWGGAIILGGVVALMLAPVSALVLHLARRITARPLATTVLVIAVLLLIAAILSWAWAAGALVQDAEGWVGAANSIALALVMAIYCAAVAGGSWMAAIGLARFEREG
jgi:hypothetical protein